MREKKPKVEWLDYDPEKGTFTWTVNSGKAKIGDIAGSVTVKGFRAIKLKQQNYSAHRLAWFYMTGAFPPFVVEHADGNKDNNAWLNLRASERQMP